MKNNRIYKMNKKLIKMINKINKMKIRMNKMMIIYCYNKMNKKENHH